MKGYGPWQFVITETLRIEGDLQEIQHFYLCCLLVLMIQYDRMASSMHGTIYQFSKILNTELGISLNFLINKDKTVLA